MQLKIQLFGWLRVAYSVAEQSEEYFFLNIPENSHFTQRKVKKHPVLHTCTHSVHKCKKKASLSLKITVQIFHPLSSFRSAPHEHSAGPCIRSMIGIDWDTWGGKRAHVPLQIRKTRITE